MRRGCGALRQLALRCPSLRSVDATFCGSLTDDALVAAVRGLPSLQTLLLAVRASSSTRTLLCCCVRRLLAWWTGNTSAALGLSPESGRDFQLMPGESWLQHCSASGGDEAPASPHLSRPPHTRTFTR